MKIRPALKKDVPQIVTLLAADKLGSQRENDTVPLPENYYKAFEVIDKDPHQELVVFEQNDEIIGTLQLSFIHYLTYQGGVRAQIEAVRIREDQRGKGRGEYMFKWAIERAKSKRAHLIQLTTDKQRPEALGFYERLGFNASHEGLKLHL